MMMSTEVPSYIGALGGTATFVLFLIRYWKELFPSKEHKRSTDSNYEMREIGKRLQDIELRLGGHDSAFLRSTQAMSEIVDRLKEVERRLWELRK